MNSIEIKDPNVDADKIMEGIRKRIQERKSNGLYEKVLDEMMKNIINDFAKENEKLLMEIYSAKNNKNIDWNYPIKSHRPVVGRWIVLIKKLVRRMVKILLDPLFRNQEVLNTTSVNIMVSLLKKLENISIRLERIEKLMSSTKEE